MLYKSISSFKYLFSRSIGQLCAHLFAPPVSYVIFDRVRRSRKVEDPLGFYIEAGANDGIKQSNTIALESVGWRGILIEPSKCAFDALVRNRCKRNKFFNCALVPDGSIEEVIGDFDGGLMSSLGGSRTNKTANVKVRARTLQSILDECEIERVDLLSLDVEGYELEVLKGLDLRKNPPTLVVVELYPHNFDAVSMFLIDHGYSQPANLSRFSSWTHPNWDGLHNDYLFTYTK